MKKIISLAVPIIAVSLLASCSQPTCKFTFTGENCKINNLYSFSGGVYGKAQYTIVADDEYALPETIESNIGYVRTTNQAAILTINNEIKGNVNVTIKANPILQTFTVAFDANGGEFIEGVTNPIVVESTHSVPIKDVPKLKDRPGYDKSNVTWIDKETGESFTFGEGGTQVTKNTIVQANWGVVDQFTVNFYNDDGVGYNGLTNLKVNYGDKVTYKDCPLDDTYDDHYTFDGWYDRKPSESSAQLFSFDTPLTGDSSTPISIYAKHTKKNYHVTFDANGGEFTSGGNPMDVAYQDTIDTSKRPVVKRDGYDDTTTWCTDKDGEHIFEFGNTQIEENTTLYAKWGEPIDPPSTTYTVTFDGGSFGYFVNGKRELSLEFSKDTKDVTLYEIIRSFNCIPVISVNNVFAYYTYVNGSSIDYNDKVTGDDMTLQAHYFPISTPYTDLEDISWQKIHDVAVTNPHPETCFAIGATKHVDVDGYNHLVKIIGFNHDQLSTSTSEHRQYAGITFEFFNLLTENSHDGAIDTVWQNAFIGVNNYKYSTCTLRNLLNEGENSIFNRFPDELKAEGMIQKVYKLVAETSSYTINHSYSDKLFPLAYYEMSGSSHSCAKNEGAQYEYWRTHNSNEDRIKKTTKDQTYSYWLRSPDTHDSSQAWCINGDGSFRYQGGIIYDDRFARCIAPAFCI